MKKTICDRCKKEIIREPSQQMLFPIVSILKSYSLNLMDCVNVDLCDKCKEEFLSWLDVKVVESENKE